MHSPLFFKLVERMNAEERRRVDDKVIAMRNARLAAAKTAVERHEALEDDLGRVALLARALAQLCLRQGILKAEDLKNMLLEVDLVDGAADHRLDPKAVMPGAKTAPRKRAAKPGSAAAPKPDREPRAKRRES